MKELGDTTFRAQTNYVPKLHLLLKITCINILILYYRYLSEKYDITDF